MDPTRAVAAAGRSLRGIRGRLRALLTGPEADDPEAADLLADPGLQASLATYAAQHGIPLHDVTDEAAGYLRQMLASHSERATHF